jgi:hypothetical protein
MKNVLLCLIALTIAIAGYSQRKPVLRHDVIPFTNVKSMNIGADPVKASPVIKAPVIPPVNYKNTQDVNFVSVVSIGTGPNGYSYGYRGGQKSILTANNDLNTITHIHRMGGTLDPGGYPGDLGYDISTDGGINWTNMVECYTSTIPAGQYNLDAARYPNCGLYNPEGNLDPNNAYVVFFAPTLDNSNTQTIPGWGGYAYGRGRIGDIGDTTKHLDTSVPPFYNYNPDAFDVSDDGIFITIDYNMDWTGASGVYQGNFIVSRGVWDDGLQDFVMDKSLLDFPVLDSLGAPSGFRFAFGPDGQTGWLVTLADNGAFEPLPNWGGYHTLYPILFKTTDGGLNWSDPIPVRLDGPDGLPGILNYLTQSQIDTFFTAPVPAREEIQYCTAFDCDIAVDFWGNPHVAVMVSIAGLTSSYSLYTSPPYYLAAFDIFSTDGGTTWDAFKCGNVKTFRYIYGAATDYEDNRIQISTTQKGDKVFVTWLDTRVENVTDNSAPDIWARGIAVNQPPVPWLYTANPAGEDSATNVTQYSEAMWTSFWAVTSKITLDNNGTYTVPFTYMQNGPPFSMDLPVQYKYIQDFSYTDADFLIMGVGEKDNKNITSVSQNYPNPFSRTSTVQVNIVEKANLKLVVTNLIGQQMMQIERGDVAPGMHEFVIDGSKLSNGIYFYTVYAGKESITRKMIVE